MAYIFHVPNPMRVYRGNPTTNELWPTIDHYYKGARVPISECRIWRFHDASDLVAFKLGGTDDLYLLAIEIGEIERVMTMETPLTSSDAQLQEAIDRRLQDLAEAYDTALEKYLKPDIATD